MNRQELASLTTLQSLPSPSEPPVPTTCRFQFFFCLPPSSVRWHRCQSGPSPGWLNLPAGVCEFVTHAHHPPRNSPPLPFTHTLTPGSELPNNFVGAHHKEPFPRPKAMAPGDCSATTYTPELISLAALAKIFFITSISTSFAYEAAAHGYACHNANSSPPPPPSLYPLLPIAPFLLCSPPP